MEIRLQKYMADAGIASRRASEKLIEQGLVKVNGLVVTEQGIKVDPQKDVIEYNGSRISQDETFVYYMLYKPVRVVSTASDEKNRESVVDMIECEHRLYPVGRLDFMTSGLILLTNDGDLTYKLTHPKHEIEKNYIARVSPKVSNEDIELLRNGIELEAYTTSPCTIKRIESRGDSETYSIILKEGKNRQVRRMFEHVGARIVSLERVSVGKLTLSGLGYGEYRQLTEEEVEYLKQL